MTMHKETDMPPLSEEALDAILTQHHLPRADSTLEQRIIAAATTPRTVIRLSPWQAMLDLLRPAPVAAFACSLLLGVIAGQFLPENPLPSQQPSSVSVPKLSHNAGAFLYYNGEVL